MDRVQGVGIFVGAALALAAIAGLWGRQFLRGPFNRKHVEARLAGLILLYSAVFALGLFGVMRGYVPSVVLFPLLAGLIGLWFIVTASGEPKLPAR